MDEKHACLLCHNETHESGGREEYICESCSDILEFGYPSFPSYPLEEGSKKMEHTEKSLL